MKALTIWQPWATFVVKGFKPWEFRNWKCYDSMVGQRIVVHAAARKMKRSEIAALYDALRAGGQRGASTCIKPAALNLLKAHLFDDFEFPLGCGLGTATIGAPQLGNECAREFGVTTVETLVDSDDEWNWGWPMLDVDEWADPFPMKGAQGFWNWPGPESVGL